MNFSTPDVAQVFHHSGVLVACPLLGREFFFKCPDASLFITEKFMPLISSRWSVPLIHINVLLHFKALQLSLLVVWGQSHRLSVQDVQLHPLPVWADVRPASHRVREVAMRDLRSLWHVAPSGEDPVGRDGHVAEASGSRAQLTARL